MAARSFLFSHEISSCYSMHDESPSIGFLNILLEIYIIQFIIFNVRYSHTYNFSKHNISKEFKTQVPPIYGCSCGSNFWYLFHSKTNTCSFYFSNLIESNTERTNILKWTRQNREIPPFFLQVVECMQLNYSYCGFENGLLTNRKGDP